MNKNMLLSQIRLHGMTVRSFLSALKNYNISFTSETFYRKLSGRSEFKQSEINAICHLLKLNDRELINIFFAKEVA